MRRVVFLFTVLLALILNVAVADTLVLPADTEIIEAEAFYGIHADTVILPEGVTSIGENAFGGNSGLTVYVPDSLMERETAALGNSTDSRFVSLNADWHEIYDYEISPVTAGMVITKYKLSEAKVSIPAVIEGRTVTEIGASAFANKGSLTSVQIPEGVSVIGNNAFSGCSSLKEVLFPSALSQLGPGAFAGCGRDVAESFSYRLPDHITSLTATGSSADSFNGCKAIKVVSPGSETAYTLSDLSHFSNINNNVYQMQWFTFAGCEDYRYLYMTGTDETTSRLHLMKYMAQGTSASVPSLSGVVPEVIHDEAFLNKTSLTQVVLPEGVETLGTGAFSGCTGLTDISLPDSLRTIGSNAFTNCGSSAPGAFCFRLPDHLTSIVMSNSTRDSFYNCNAVRVVTPGSATACLCSDYYQTQNPPNPEAAWPYYWFTFEGQTDFRYLYEETDPAAADSRILKLIKYVGNGTQVVIPSQGSGLPVLSRLEFNCFKDKTAITKVVIPEGVTALGANAFSGCTNLTDVSFPDSLRTIESRAFSNCGSGASGTFCFRLPDHLTSIVMSNSSVDSFASCNAVRVVTPGSDTAYLCSDYYQANNPPNPEAAWPYYWFTFAGQEDFRYLYHKADGENGSRSLRLIKYTGSGPEVVIPAQAEGVPGLELLDYNCFYNQTGITRVTIPEGVTTLARNAFYGCTRLCEIQLPDSLHYLEENVFYRCASYYKTQPDYNSMDMPVCSIPDEILDYVYTSSSSDTFYECDIRFAWPGPDTTTYRTRKGKEGQINGN
ncbi:MAG: leucine-rich repeat domain-containing protein [Clostridia bacterium]|nr:leucine-rich repeat domain-containing protein [Clostridia bacterium]